MVLPVSTTSMRKISSVFSRNLAASFLTSLARSFGSSAAHPGCAASAAATALLTSAAVPCGTWPSVSSLAGFTDSSHSPASLGTSSPPISIMPRMRLDWWTFIVDLWCFCELWWRIWQRDGGDGDASDLGNLGLFDHLLPLGDLRIHVDRKFGRGIALRLDAGLQQLFLDVGAVDDRGDLTLQQIDDRLRRSRRHEHAGHGFGLLAADAKLFERRNVGQCGRALVGGN